MEWMPWQIKKRRCTQRKATDRRVIPETCGFLLGKLKNIFKLSELKHLSS